MARPRTRLAVSRELKWRTSRLEQLPPELATMIVLQLDPYSRYQVMRTCRWLNAVTTPIMIRDVIVRPNHGARRVKHLTDQQLSRINSLARTDSALETIAETFKLIDGPGEPWGFGERQPTKSAQRFYSWLQVALPKMVNLRRLVLRGVHTFSVEFEVLLAQAANGNILPHLNEIVYHPVGMHHQIYERKCPPKLLFALPQLRTLEIVDGMIGHPLVANHNGAITNLHHMGRLCGKLTTLKLVNCYIYSSTLKKVCKIQRDDGRWTLRNLVLKGNCICDHGGPNLALVLGASAPKLHILALIRNHVGPHRETLQLNSVPHIRHVILSSRVVLEDMANLPGRIMGHNNWRIERRCPDFGFPRTLRSLTVMWDMPSNTSYWDQRNISNLISLLARLRENWAMSHKRHFTCVRVVIAGVPDGIELDERFLRSYGRSYIEVHHIGQMNIRHDDPMAVLGH